MSNSPYDIIVAGTGSMGAAACYYLASAGCSVLGLEQFPELPHENGSHAGQSRIIRKAYFEHKDYVPLLQRAYTAWENFEAATGEKIFYKTGLIYYGPAGHSVIYGIKDAARSYDIELNKVNEFSFFNESSGYETWMEPDAGFVLPEKTIRLYVDEARKKGAEIRTGEKILRWEKSNGIYYVHTAANIYTANKLIFTSGAWSGQLLPQLQKHLKITRQVLIWIEPQNKQDFMPEKFPCWIIAGDNFNGVYYGFPYLNGERFPGPAGLKLALHFPAESSDPDSVNRGISEQEINATIAGLAKYFPSANGKVIAAKTCLYANSPDDDFIIDFLPGYEKDVIIACGFSGHGFKFVPVIGEILAEMAIKGGSSLPIAFLNLQRFSR